MQGKSKSKWKRPQTKRMTIRLDCSHDAGFGCAESAVWFRNYQIRPKEVERATANSTEWADAIPSLPSSNVKFPPRQSRPCLMNMLRGSGARYPVSTGSFFPISNHILQRQVTSNFE